MLKNATLEQRIAWHTAHQKNCSCRPIPAKLLEQIRRISTPTPPKPPTAPKKRSVRVKRASEAAMLDPRFASVIEAFASDRQVVYGGKGFASSGLKVRGKLFAMISSKGKFVAKLPKSRVAELVRVGKGEYFDPGHGRLMKEWVALDGEASSWVELAQEARWFVGSKA